MSELRECPFCGCRDIRPEEKDDPYVWCKNPKCQIYDIELHINKWNTRAIDATIAAIQAELDLWESFDYLTDREQTMNLVGAIRRIIAGEEE